MEATCSSETSVEIQRTTWPPAFTLFSFSDYSSTLKMEAICSSEISVDFQQTTRRYIPEDSSLHNHRCENLKSFIEYIFLFHTSLVLHNLSLLLLLCIKLLIIYYLWITMFHRPVWYNWLYFKNLFLNKYNKFYHTGRWNIVILTYLHTRS
jgi:hypothetical protein